MELRAKVIELECVLGEIREKLRLTQQQNSELESRLSDTVEELSQKQTLVNALEEEETQLTSALDEVSLVSVCESVSRIEHFCSEGGCLAVS